MVSSMAAEATGFQAGEQRQQRRRLSMGGEYAEGSSDAAALALGDAARAGAAPAGSDDQIHNVESANLYTWILPQEHGPAQEVYIRVERAEERTPNLGPPHADTWDTFQTKDLDPEKYRLRAQLNWDTFRTKALDPEAENYRLRVQLKHAQYEHLTTWSLRNIQRREDEEMPNQWQQQ